MVILSCHKDTKWIFLGDISLLPGIPLLTGGFNIHVNKPEK